MFTPTTAWDRAPTDAELNAYYGKPKSSKVSDLIIETITNTVRNVSHKSLSVPYVTYRNLDAVPKVMPYPLVEVFSDYGAEPKLMAALMAVIEKSDCPLVAAYRLAVAERFADAHADEVEEMQG
jgi:hypothetical protein